MKYILFPLIISLLYAQSKALPNYKIVNEVVYDAPIKTQVEQHILVSGEINEDNLKRLLHKQFKSIMGRNNFKYHPKPTSVYIYTYDSKEKAETEQGLWIAMLQIGPLDNNEPKITVKQNIINQIGENSKEIFGFSEIQQKQIYKEIILAERKATDVAMKREPSDIYKQIELEDKLVQKYKNDLAIKYSLNREQLGKIGIEGVVNQWLRPRL